MTTQEKPVPDPARAIDVPVTILPAGATHWIPTVPGKDFRPLRFEADGWSELMRLVPGTVVPLHRHSGEAHVYTISGARQMLDTGQVISAGDYAYEAAGAVDTWRAIGDEPCILHLKLSGTVEYVGEGGEVTGMADSASQREAYLEWCATTGRDPEPRLMHIPAEPDAPR